MKRQPLLMMLLCFAAGIAFTDDVHPAFSTAFTLLIVGSCSAFLLLLGSNFWLQKLKVVFLGIFFFSVGVFVHFLNSENPVLPNFDGKHNIIFKLNKKLNSNEKYRRYEAKIIKIEDFKGKVLPLKAIISVPKEKLQLDFKHYYQSKIYLNRIARPNNSFQFDYAQYSARQNIYYQLFIKDDLQRQLKADWSFSDKIKQQRLDVLNRIDGSGLQATTKAFLKGIILADRTEMDAATVTDFSRSGLMHFLAISGSHMAIIFFMLFWFFKRLFPLRFKKYPIVISLVFIWLFAFFIGFGSSVMRSCIMITAYYLYVILDRKPDFLHAVALAGFIILILDSHQLFDVGFQLSFLAVLGIFWLNNPILKLFGNLKGFWSNFFGNVVSMSLSAQIATLPLVLYYFHQYSLVSVLANLLIIPFSEVIILFSLLMTVLFAFGVEFNFLSILYEYVVHTLLKSIHWFATIDFGFFKNVPMTVSEVALLLLIGFLLRNVLVRKDIQSYLNFSFAVFLFLTVRLGLDAYRFQKDEVLVTDYFKNKVVLVKSGNTVEVFADRKINPEKLRSYIVDPYLSSRRVRDFKLNSMPNDAKAMVVNGRKFSLK